MKLHEELYFEITLSGIKSELKKFISYLKSGELDDFFDISSEYIHYDDDFDTDDPEKMLSVTFSNDDYGIEIDEFDTDEFLEVFCKAAKSLEVEGRLFDVDDEEYSFVSEKGAAYYINARNISFNEDEDKPDEDDD